MRRLGRSNAADARGASRAPELASKVCRKRRREGKRAMGSCRSLLWRGSSRCARSQHPEYLLRRLVRGIYSYCILRRFARLSVSRFAGQGGSEIRPTLDGTGVRGESVAKLLFRFAILALLAKQSPEIDGCFGKMRRDPQSAPEVFFRHGQLTALCGQNTQLIFGPGKIGVESKSSSPEPPVPAINLLCDQAPKRGCTATCAFSGSAAIASR